MSIPYKESCARSIGETYLVGGARLVYGTHLSLNFFLSGYEKLNEGTY
jgi:hypothetical protein